MAGDTDSVDFPVAAPFQATLRGTPDCFVARVDTATGSLDQASYLGGSSNESGCGIAVDDAGTAYVAGSTISRDFPVTPDAYQSIYAESGTPVIRFYDAFLAKIDFSATIQPVTLVSAASYATGAALAPESIANASGKGLATSMQGATSQPLPTTLASTSVVVKDIAGVERQASLLFVSPTQITFLVPAGTRTGPATVAVRVGGSVVATGSIEIAGVAPALFAANQNGRGVAAALAVRAKAGGPQSWEYVFPPGCAPGSCVASPIDLGTDSDPVFLQLYGTGIRGRSSLAAVSAKIGGVDARVDYAGPAPDFAGLDQVNLLIPRALIGRGEVDVALMVDGNTANSVTVNIK